MAEVDYELRLYVLGRSPKSVAAEGNLRRVCERELAGRYALEVVDVLQQPDLAERDKVLATPTLIRLKPLPSLRLVGDMSVTDKVLLGLGLGPHSWLTRNAKP